MSLSSPHSHHSSFRDPAGFIFTHQGNLFRQINFEGQKDYEQLLASGLYEELVNEKLLVAHREVPPPAGLKADPRRFKIIKPELVPFVSYPYEWSFSQLRDAGLLSLYIQRRALARGLILKDASPYNIQFIGQKPIFIDTLSFKIYEAGAPWEAYKQFCEQFITPLALTHYGNLQAIRTLRVFLDGIALDDAVNMLPARARFRPGLNAHIYLHAASQRRYEKKRTTFKPKPRRVSPLAMNGLLSSLEKTLKKFKMPTRKTEWSDYYSDTNYSARAFSHKKQIVAEILRDLKPKNKIVWDLGANDGTFSDLAAKEGAYTVAFDIDPAAVNINYLKKRDSETGELILPLNQNLANPSPALGWAHAERESLMQRGPADITMALALIHHIAINNTLPFFSIADFFAKISRYLIIEFIPKSDSKVQLLLRSRAHHFNDYTKENFEAAFSQKFKLLAKYPVKDSQRVIYLYKT